MKNIMNKILSTQDDTSMLVVRLVLGGVMFPHGAQKLFGWFGGYGWSGTMNFFTQTMGIPWIFAVAAILAESLGSIALIVGLCTRLAAVAIATNMVVAVLTSHLQAGFFMNWFGNQKGEGFEYHLLTLGLAAALIIKGGGKASMDLALSATHPSLELKKAQ
jgi:putative oxidoreductase